MAKADKSLTTDYGTSSDSGVSTEESVLDAPVSTEPEPVINLDEFHLAKGHIIDVIGHMKAWIEWRLKNTPEPQSTAPTE